MFFMVLDLTSASYIGWPIPALQCLSFRLRTSFMFDATKVQHFSCVSKFQPSIWGDFDDEFIEIAPIRTSSILVPSMP